MLIKMSSLIFNNRAFNDLLKMNKVLYLFTEGFLGNNAVFILIILLKFKIDPKCAFPLVDTYTPLIFAGQK